MKREVTRSEKIALAVVALPLFSAMLMAVREWSYYNQQISHLRVSEVVGAVLAEAIVFCTMFFVHARSGALMLGILSFATLKLLLSVDNFDFHRGLWWSSFVGTMAALVLALQMVIGPERQSRQMQSGPSRLRWTEKTGFALVALPLLIGLSLAIGELFRHVPLRLTYLWIWFDFFEACATLIGSLVVMAMLSVVLFLVDGRRGASLLAAVSLCTFVSVWGGPPAAEPGLWRVTVAGTIAAFLLGLRMAIRFHGNLSARSASESEIGRVQ